MKYKKYKKKNKKKHISPTDVSKLDMPKGSKFSPVEKAELNVPYYFRESEWEF